MKKNEIITIYSVFYLILYPQQVILGVEDKKTSVNVNAHNFFQNNLKRSFELGLIREQIGKKGKNGNTTRNKQNN